MGLDRGEAARSAHGSNLVATADVFDLEAFLEGLPAGTLAWMANRLADQPKGHGWASRDEAIAAALHCHEALDDGDPIKELPWRFANTPTLAE